MALSSSGIMMIVLNSFEFQLQMHPVHKIFGILLTISGIFHLYLNFNAIKKYLGHKKMMIFAVILTFFMVGLYAVGASKPLDTNKIQQIEKILQTMQN